MHGEIELALLVAFASRGVAQGALYLSQRRVLLRVEMGSPFHRLLGAKENRDKKSFECYGKDAQMRRLAQAIITDQQLEIQLMERWLKQWESVHPTGNHTPAPDVRKDN